MLSVVVSGRFKEEQNEEGQRKKKSKAEANFSWTNSNPPCVWSATRNKFNESFGKCSAMNWPSWIMSERVEAVSMIFFFWKIVDWSWSKILNYHLVIVLELIKSIIKLFNKLSLAFGKRSAMNRPSWSHLSDFKNLRLKSIKKVKQSFNH